MKRPLTMIQIKTMFAIAWIRFLRKYPPSFRELCAYFRIFVRAAWDRCRWLRKKEMVDWDKSTVRTIRITPTGLEALKNYGFRPTTQQLYKKINWRK